MKRPWSNLPIQERMDLLKSYSRAGFSYKDAMNDFSNILKSYEEGGVIEKPIENPYIAQPASSTNVNIQQPVINTQEIDNFRTQNKLFQNESNKNIQSIIDYENSKQNSKILYPSTDLRRNPSPNAQFIYELTNPTTAKQTEELLTSVAEFTPIGMTVSAISELADISTNKDRRDKLLKDFKKLAFPDNTSNNIKTHQASIVNLDDIKATSKYIASNINTIEKIVDIGSFLEYTRAIPAVGKVRKVLNAVSKIGRASDAASYLIDYGQGVEKVYKGIKNKDAFEVASGVLNVALGAGNQFNRDSNPTDFIKEWKNTSLSQTWNKKNAQGKYEHRKDIRKPFFDVLGSAINFSSFTTEDARNLFKDTGSKVDIENGIIETDANIKTDSTDNDYFRLVKGSFKSKENAEKFANSTDRIIQKDSMYRVISDNYKTEEEARKELNRLRKEDKEVWLWIVK